MKVLFTASVTGHLRAFHIPYLRYFKEKGFEVHTAACGDALPFTDRHYNIRFERSPYKFSNLSAYRALKKIIAQNSYDLIHCHTPVAAALTRLAARKARKAGTAVLYTAHGFHFYKGAPFLQSMVFRMVEKALSRHTDCLITINEEDYQAVRKYGFKPGACYKVPGVGVDAARFQAQTPQNKAESRKNYGIKDDAFVLVFAAELSRRKNQQLLIQAAAFLKRSIPGLLLLLPGEGPMRKDYEKMIAACGLKENVRLMGYRRDMDSLLLLADMAVSSALQEGLPVNIVEAMSVSLPVVATNIRGHADLITDGINGFLTDTADAQAFADKLFYLYTNPQVMQQMSENTIKMVQPFLMKNAFAETVKIYENMLREK